MRHEFSELGERPKNQISRVDRTIIRTSNVVFWILVSLLCFETTAPQMPKLGQISKYLSPLVSKIKPKFSTFWPPVKFRGVGKMSEWINQLPPRIVTADMLLSGCYCAGLARPCLLVKKRHTSRQNIKSMPTNIGWPKKANLTNLKAVYNYSTSTQLAEGYSTQEIQ